MFVRFFITSNGCCRISRHWNPTEETQESRKVDNVSPSILFSSTMHKVNTIPLFSTRYRLKANCYCCQCHWFCRRCCWCWCWYRCSWLFSQFQISKIHKEFNSIAYSFISEFMFMHDVYLSWMKRRESRRDGKNIDVDALFAKRDPIRPICVASSSLKFVPQHKSISSRICIEFSTQHFSNLFLLFTAAFQPNAEQICTSITPILSPNHCHMSHERGEFNSIRISKSIKLSVVLCACECAWKKVNYLVDFEVPKSLR